MTITTIAALAVSVLTVPAYAATPPRLTNPGAWLEKREAPAESLKQGERALTALDLTIAPDGSIAACDIALSSKSPTLDRYACALFRQNARYEPLRSRNADQSALRKRRDFWIWEAPKSSRDSSSKASIAVSRSGADRWVTTDDLPKDALAPDQVITSNVALTISSGGRVTACNATLPSERPDLDRHVCDLMIARARYKPARDAAGHSTQGMDWKTVRWQVPRD